MGKKITINYIKQFFDSEECTLLSTEYINSQTPLDFICSNGHRFKITWNHWQQGHRCGKCSKYHVGLIYEFVKQSFENEKYQLLSTEYIDNKTYLEIICPNGHKHKIIWINWQQGQRCPKCSMQGTSKPEKEIREYVMKNYIGTVLYNDRTLIKNPKSNRFLELDIWLPEIRKAIEYGADWYHSDKYQKWKDSYKKQWCKDHGIELLVINDKNWIKNKNYNMIYEFIK